MDTGVACSFLEFPVMLGGTQWIWGWGLRACFPDIPGEADLLTGRVLRSHASAQTISCRSQHLPSL